MIKNILKTLYSIKWYILGLVFLFILIKTGEYPIVDREDKKIPILSAILRSGKKTITDTYAYMILLNLTAYLVPFLILRKHNALDYFKIAFGFTIFSVWFGYYLTNFIISEDEKAFMTEEIEVYRYAHKYTPRRSIICRYKGDFVYLPRTKESEQLYEIYGDSVIKHIHVRLSLKKALPHVYYIDDAFIEYDED